VRRRSPAGDSRSPSLKHSAPSSAFGPFGHRFGKSTRSGCRDRRDPAHPPHSSFQGAHQEGSTGRDAGASRRSETRFALVTPFGCNHSGQMKSAWAELKLTHHGPRQGGVRGRNRHSAAVDEVQRGSKNYRGSSTHCKLDQDWLPDLLRHHRLFNQSIIAWLSPFSPKLGLVERER